MVTTKNIYRRFPGYSIKVIMAGKFYTWYNEMDERNAPSFRNRYITDIKIDSTYLGIYYNQIYEDFTIVRGFFDPREWGRDDDEVASPNFSIPEIKSALFKAIFEHEW